MQGCVRKVVSAGVFLACFFNCTGLALTFLPYIIPPGGSFALSGGGCKFVFRFLVFQGCEFTAPLEAVVNSCSWSK